MIRSPLLNTEPELCGLGVDLGLRVRRGSETTALPVGPEPLALTLGISLGFLPHHQAGSQAPLSLQARNGQTPSLCSSSTLRDSHKAFLTAKGGRHKRIRKQEEELWSTAWPPIGCVTLSNLINLSEPQCPPSIKWE